MFVNQGIVSNFATEKNSSGLNFVKACNYCGFDTATEVFESSVEVLWGRDWYHERGFRIHYYTLVKKSDLVHDFVKKSFFEDVMFWFFWKLFNWFVKVLLRSSNFWAIHLSY